MPSLFRYFLIVGSALLGLLLLVNHWLEPVAPPAQAAAAPQKLAVRHDPRASIIERWRNEQAARKAAERGAAEAPVTAAVSEPITPVSEPSPTRPEPPQIVAPVALVAPLAEPDAEARKAEQIRAAQVRKARIARERARARRQEEAASRQQDPFFYGGPRPAYAAAPTSGPFGAGRTW
jgi:hypothetical protein